MVQRRLHPELLPDLPLAIAASPLLAHGGIGVYEGLVAGTVLQQLIDESIRSYATAADQGSSVPNPEENRGGTPLRRFLTGAGGPVQQAFYQSDWVRAFLEHATRLRLKPTGSVGTFSYYVRPGDFLDLHRDIVTCDLAVITLLHQEGRASDGGGALCVYPARHREALSAIRRTPNEGALGSARVSMDEDWKPVKTFVAEKSVNYPVVIDSQGVARKYALSSMPMTLLIDRSGEIAASYVGVVDKGTCESKLQTLLQTNAQ